MVLKYSGANSFSTKGGVNEEFVYAEFHYRPSVTLKSESIILSGDGTQYKSYIIG